MGYDVRLDGDECLSSGKCILAAPDFFVFDDDQIATIADDAPRPADEVLLRAARHCPSGAIALLDDGVEIDL